MKNIQKNIGENLKEFRKARGLSLDQAAEMTGVSKAMLGQIERGESNPTVNTLWKIATGLQVSFSSIIKDNKADVLYVEKNSIPPLTEGSGNYRVYPIFPFDPRRKFEIFTVEMDLDCVHRSEKHNEGVEEYITVTTGELEVTIGEEKYCIPAGDSIRFSADQEHIYYNKHIGITSYQLVIYYP